MAAKIIHPSLPKNKDGHTLYQRAWRAVTGKKYKLSPEARRRKNERARVGYVKPAPAPPAPVSNRTGIPNERPRFPRSCGVRAAGVSGRNQKLEPNVAVVIDTRSKTIADIEAKFAEIDRRQGGK